MFPRNAASPPRVYVGPVIAIADGAVQTSGVAVTVTPEGGSETAAGGTVAYSTKGGVWYTPTQAETNYPSFMVEASKADCHPIGVTVVTTATATPGTVVVTTNNDKSGYGLADDAITNAKFDESTAFPLKSADTGATAVARTGADSDTLETLSDQIDGVGGGTAPTVEQIRAEIDSNSTQLAAIAAKTTNLPSDPADQSLIIAATNAIVALIGTPAGASMSADIAAITSNLSLIAPTTDAADSATVTTGTEIAGTYVKTQTDDNDRYTLAPVNPGGLDLTMVFEIGLGRAPVSVTINGYWNGSGQYANVYAYDYVIGVWDCLTNSSTRMASRTSDANYSFPLNREHIDPASGDVSIRFVSPSTNTAHRLYLDRVLVGTIDQSQGATAGITAQDIWTYVARTLTSDSGEPVDSQAIATAVAALILETPANKLETDANGYVTANVNGSITVSGDVTLAANQPNYAPAKAGDEMALTAAYDAAKTAAQASDIPTADITAIKGKTDNLPSDPADQSLIIAATNAITSALGSLPTPGDATEAKQDSIISALGALDSGQTTIINNTENIINNVENVTNIIQGGEAGAGSGHISWPITIKDDNQDPIADVDVAIVAVEDPDGDPVASGKTDSFGVLVPEPMLDPGSYYVYRQKTGENFNNPQTITVA
jgi:hypothetical protein